MNQDAFLNNVNNIDQTKMRLLTGWNAAGTFPNTSKYSTSPIGPDPSIYVNGVLRDTLLPVINLPMQMLGDEANTQDNIIYSPNKKTSPVH